jgi:hypothetical protein
MPVAATTHVAWFEVPALALTEQSVLLLKAPLG